MCRTCGAHSIRYSKFQKINYFIIEKTYSFISLYVVMYPARSDDCPLCGNSKLITGAPSVNQKKTTFS